MYGFFVRHNIAEYFATHEASSGDGKSRARQSRPDSYYRLRSRWFALLLCLCGLPSALTAQAALTSPAPGAKLSGSSATFSWSAGSGVEAYQLCLGTTGVGSSNLYDSGHITATSVSVTGLPVYGQKIYARLFSEIGGAWSTVDYTYTASGAPVLAKLSTPGPSSVLSGANVTFTWTAGSGVAAYQLFLGTTGVGSYNLYDSGHITATSATVAGLPIYGQKIYARLYSEVTGVWQSVDYTYTASGSPVRAVLQSPAPGGVLSGSSATFTWTAGGGVVQNGLFLGTTGVGSHNLYSSSSLTATSVNVTDLPTDGIKIYARLFSEIAGVWDFFDYTYTAAGSAVPAALSTPAPGTKLSGSSATFKWTAGNGIEAYQIYVGTGGVGSDNLYDSGHTTATSATVTGLPSNDQKIYVRLFSQAAGIWSYVDYTYTEAGSPVLSVLSSPAPGSTLSGASATFTWTAGSVVESYQLNLGTNGVGSSNLYDSGHTTATSAAVTGLPLKGAKIYARLYSEINGVWQSTDYTYTEALPPAPAALATPAPGSTLAGSSATFSWTAGGQVQSYQLFLGTAGVGSDNLYDSGHTAATSASVTGLPAYGQKIYARLFSEIAGVWQSVDYTYTESGSPVAAALTTPAPASVLPGSSATFTWTAGGGVTSYELLLGTAGVGASNLYSSGHTTATSASVTGLPANGAKIYARLYSDIAGVWQSVDYTYTEAGPAALSALSCTSASMTGPGTDACTVTLNVAAPTGGLTVSLSSNNAAATVPASVSVPANATSAGFATTVSSLATAQAVKLTATGGGASKTFALQLNADKPTLSLATSSSPSSYGSAVKFTATISSGPTGTVTFYNGSASIGTAAISGTTASVTTSSLTAASHAITAGWLGNSSYAAVTSAVMTQVVNKATPVITWNTPPAITYGTALSSAQLDASSTVPGTFVYSTAAGTVPAAGSQTLSVTFTPTDTADYNTASANVKLTVNKVTPLITWATPAAVTYGTALSAAQLNATASVAGTFAYSPAAGTVPAAGSQTLSVTFTPTNTTDYSTASANVTLMVGSSKQTITWATPAAITYGTALSAAQLNATAGVAGTFVYTPAAGTVLAAGSQTLSVTFTPTNTADYSSSTASVKLTVNKATPTIAWRTPAAITYGPALNATQLDATAGVAGTFAYSPASGTVLAAGSQTLSVTFTPTNTTDYSNASASVTQTVNKATPTITWGTPAAITYGTALSATQLDATATVAGTFAYSPGAGTVPAAGLQKLSVTFTPTNTTDYSTASASVTLSVNAATSAITWASPAAITYGTALSAAQLNATSGVAGTFVYTPAAGTVLAAGSQTLSVTFTPTNTAEYSSSTASVTLTVNKATPAITWRTPAAIPYGTALSATQLNATASVAGTFAYTPATGTVLAAGSQTLSVTFTPTNATNYNNASASITQIVTNAAPTITWGTPAAITYCTALSAAQLNATSSVAGTFAYSPASGTVPAAGSQTLSVIFTPTNTTDYSVASANVTLTVNKATPTITWATPAAITSGTALSATQLDATASVAGTFAYSPAAGTVLATGSHTLSVTFTPTNTTDYNTATDSVTLPVNQAISILTLNATGVGFGNVVLNQPATQTLTLSSTGTAPVTVNSAVMTGTGFTMTTPAFPLTLAPGQTATLVIVFDPTAVGAVTGALTISSTSSNNGVAVVGLSGTGAPATSYSVDLSWDPPTETTDPVVGYNILRSPSGSSNYQLLNSSVDNLTTYVDSTVQTGTAYNYSVESVDGSGNVSIPSSPITVTIP